MQSRITELDPPHRLAITWDGSGTVSFELEPRGKDVLLTIIHRRLTDRAAVLMFSAGWHMHLDTLAARLNGEATQPVWDGWSRLKTEYDHIIPAYTAGTFSSDAELNSPPLFNTTHETETTMISHSFTTSFTDQTPEAAFAAFNNVRGWWSQAIEGPTDVALGTFDYHFQDMHRCTIKVTDLIPAERSSGWSSITISASPKTKPSGKALRSSSTSR